MKMTVCLETIGLIVASVIRFGRPFNRGKENRKTFMAKTKRWPRTLNGGSTVECFSSKLRFSGKYLF